MTRSQTVTETPSSFYSPLGESLQRSVELLFRQQSQEGYWWYTLEANETIGSGFIQLMHFLEDVDPNTQQGLVQRMLSEQRADGSWAVFFEGPSDLSTTVECYFALRLAGLETSHGALQRARQFILDAGGLTRIRVFTRIHLALFGLVPWSVCPAMPVWFMLLPSSCGVSIYEFSSWARASVVPLLLTYEARPVRPVVFSLDELYVEEPEHRVFRFPKSPKIFSLHNAFIALDQLLKILEKLPWHPGKSLAVKKAERWVREHVSRTEDIYPAMAYAAIGLSAMGYPNSDPTIRKAVEGLKRFQQKSEPGLHQQCCISPNWDTPWAGVALLEAGVDPKDPRILRAARYMIGKEIRNFRGDWSFKNPKAPASGWSFEFQNDYFPDVDDTIEALFLLKKAGLPPQETEGPMTRGLDWLLSMQCKNGGWAAFDKNNTSNWVNKIPFSDHGACLDPPTPDITGRMLELLSLFGYSRTHPMVLRALKFLRRRQEPNGSWRGRWGVSFVYGTWCVLQGLAAIGEDLQQSPWKEGVAWLKSVQKKDGGWGESCLSDFGDNFVPLNVSTASQTAWAVMGLVASGENESVSVRRGIDWLMAHQTEEGGWDESYFTGTGFPGHFYIRYHGYRYYFPLFALAKYRSIWKS